jgi:(S)-ureidoglycine aminohydrolase
MEQLYGHSRDVIKALYALRTPDGFVPSWLPGWRNAVPIVHISPAMGAQFCQWQITFGKNGEGRGNTEANEYLAYLIEGRCAARLSGKKCGLIAGSFVYLPPQTDFHFTQPSAGARMLIFEKKFRALAGYEKPGVVVGHEKTIKG